MIFIYTPYIYNSKNRCPSEILKVLNTFVKTLVATPINILRSEFFMCFDLYSIHLLSATKNFDTRHKKQVFCEFQEVVKGQKNV